MGLEEISSVSEVGVVSIEGINEVSPVEGVPVRGVVELEKVWSEGEEGMDVISPVEGASVGGVQVDVVGVVEPEVLLSEIKVETYFICNLQILP